MSTIVRRLAVAALMVAALAFSFFPGPGARAQSDDLKALNQEAVRLYQAGKYAEAISVARRALAVVISATSSAGRSISSDSARTV